MDQSNITIKIRKLSRPAPAAPSATLIAHAVIHYANGTVETTGAWFGVDRDELKARVMAWFNGLK